MRAMSTRAALPLLLLLLPCCLAAVRLVDYGAAPSTGSACIGVCSIACPCVTLQQALDAAEDGDEVWLQPAPAGPAVPCENARTDRSVLLRPHPQAASVTFECAGASRALWLDARTRNGSLPIVSLADLGFRRGRSSSGGCVRADDVSLRVQRCTFADCTASQSDDGSGGGAVFVSLHRPSGGALVSVEDSGFAACHANASGGALAVLFRARADAPAVSINRCAFHAGRAGAGGGVAVMFNGNTTAASVSVSRCEFAGGRAEGSGGAVHVQLSADAPDARVAVDRSTFADNAARGSGGAVAVLLARNAVSPRLAVPVTNCTFDASSAGGGGGAVHVQAQLTNSPAGRADVAGCTFTRSTAAADGGAVLLELQATASPEWVLHVRDCAFADSSAGVAGGAVALHAKGTDSAAWQLLVSRCSVARSRAHHSGSVAVRVDVERAQALQVAVAGCAFSDSRAVRFHGGAVDVRTRGVWLTDASVSVTDSHFHDCSAFVVAGAAVLFAELALSSGYVAEFADCTFNRTRADPLGGALILQTNGWKVSGVQMLVSRCTFRNATAQHYGGAVYGTYQAVASPGAVFAVTDSHFVDSDCRGMGGAMFVQVWSIDSPACSVQVRGCTFTGTAALAHGGAVALLLQGTGTGNSSVDISRSHFQNTHAGLDGGAVHLLYIEEAVHGAAANVTDCTFTDCVAGEAGGAVYLSAVATGAPADFAAAVQRCSFLSCSARAQGGALFAAMSRQQHPLMPQYCDGTAGSSQRRTWRSSSTLLLTDSSFLATSVTDSRGMGGALAVAGGVLTLQRCDASFTSAAYSGGFMYSTGSAAVEASHLRVQLASAAAGALIHHDGAGELRVLHSELAGVVSAVLAQSSVVTAAAAAAAPEFTGSVLTCKQGETFSDASHGASVAPEVWLTHATCFTNQPPADALIAARSYHLLWQCTPCPEGTYFLGTGRVYGDRPFPGHCHPCPFGATCTGGMLVRANPGMWGAPPPDDHDEHDEPAPAPAPAPSVLAPAARPAAARVAVRDGDHAHGDDDDDPVLPDALVRCADGYCCFDAMTCHNYDSCAPTRTGLLCGECEAGHTEVLGSAVCRPHEECGGATQDVLFWPCTVLGVAAFVAWQVRTAASNVRRVRAVRDEGRTDAALAPAIVKAAFAYYQCFPLLLIGDASSSTGAIWRVAVSLPELFNFQLQAASSGSGVCVIPGLSAVHKELLAIATAVGVLAVLPVAQVVHAVVAWFGPSAEVRCGRRRWPLQLQPPQAHVYAGAFTSLSLLTYATGTTAAIRLITCVDLPGYGSRLLLQGSVACWTAAAWWQWAVAAWLLASSALVPVALVYGGWLLRHHAITPHGYWVSLFLPLPCLALWMCRHGCQRLHLQPLGRNETMSRGAAARAAQGVASAASQLQLARSTMAALEVAYRPGAWWWDAVLLLRRLLLAALPLLLNQQPVMQALTATTLILFFLLLHMRCQPYASKLANDLDACFLAALLMASVVAMRSATLLSAAAADALVWRNRVAGGVLLALVAGFPLAAGAALLVASVRRCKRSERWCERRRWRKQSQALLDAEVGLTPLRAQLLSAV